MGCNSSKGTEVTDANAPTDKPQVESEDNVDAGAGDDGAPQPASDDTPAS
jgi:hypothetical protein